MRGEANLAVKFQRQPTATPMLRMVEGKLIQADADHARVVLGRGLAVREERDPGGRVRVGAVGVEGFALGGALRAIDLAKIKHRALRDAAVVETFVFDHTPAGVFLAIFFAYL